MLNRLQGSGRRTRRHQITHPQASAPPSLPLIVSLTARRRQGPGGFVQQPPPGVFSRIPWTGLLGSLVLGGAAASGAGPVPAVDGVLLPPRPVLVVAVRLGHLVAVVVGADGCPAEAELVGDVGHAQAFHAEQGTTRVAYSEGVHVSTALLGVPFDLTATTARGGRVGS